MSHVTSGARCCGRVASSATRREPEGGDGVAEGVGHQTQNGTGRANSFLQLIPMTGHRTRPRAISRNQGHVQSSTRHTRASCWWLSNLFAAANSAQHAALPIGAWMRPSWKSDQKVCPRWSDGMGRGKGKGTVLGNGADADSLKQNSNPSGEASE